MPSRSAVLVAGVILAALVGGCITEDAALDINDARERPAAGRPTVVALLDSGINPYHVAFAAQPGQGVEAWADAFGAEVVRLSQAGEYAERVRADEAIWSGIEPGKLYAFAGTRVMAASFGAGPGDLPILDDMNHGTPTAAAAAREAPDALVVMLQVDTHGCNVDQPENCEVLVEAAAAMAWASEQPWIDVISSSLGYAGNPPYPPAAEPGVRAFVGASRSAHDRGKTIVNSAGNYLIPTLGSQFAGPAWVICVGGAQPAYHGEAVESSRGVDIVANYTEYLPRGESIDEYGWQLGTSFGAPLVAGTLARAIALAREQGGEGAIVSSALRDALNATAVPFSVEDFDPTGKPTNDTLYNLLTYGVPVVAGPAQQGWGYVHGGMAEEIARRVLEDDLAVPPGKATAAQYQAQWQSLRESYWSAQG